MNLNKPTLKKVLAASTLTTLMVSSILLPSILKAEDTTPTLTDITQKTVDNNLPSKLEQTTGYSFVKELSSSMTPNSPFAANYGSFLYYDPTYSYNIPWTTLDFPAKGDAKLPVEYVYYATPSFDQAEAEEGIEIPLYCIDYNAASPVVSNGGVQTSYELSLHTNAFAKYDTITEKSQFKESTMMLAPLLYGYPIYQNLYSQVNLTEGEQRWATSMAFKFISGSLTSGNETLLLGLDVTDFYNDDTLVSGFNNLVTKIPEVTPITSFSKILPFLSGVTGSSGFNSSTSSIEYDVISGYSTDTDRSGEVLGSIYTMINGAQDIRNDSCNYERTIYLEAPSNITQSTYNTYLAKGPYTIHLNQGTKYSSANNEYFTDLLLRDTLDIAVTNTDTSATTYIGDADGNAFNETDGIYNIPTETPFYIYTNSSADTSTVTVDITPQSITNVANAYYQGQNEAGLDTQRMLIYSPLSLSGQFTSSFSKQSGNIRIVKVDKTDNTITLENVQFEVYDNAQCEGTPIATMTTDSEGKATCEVPYATYYLKEVAAPANYLVDSSTPIEITVSADTEALAEYKTITNTPLGSLTIKKTDSITGSELANAVFELYSNEDIVYKNETVKAGNAIGGEKITGTSGIVSWDLLPYGTYTLSETRSPENYAGAVYIEPITISGNSVNTRFYEMDVDNTPYGSLTIIKKDSVSDEFLQGAKFEVITQSDITYKGTDYKANTVIENLTTDKGGTAIVRSLPFGTYTINEIEAPNGYFIDEASKNVTISGDSLETLNVSSTFTDTPYGSLTINKIDSITKEELSNVSFDLITLSSIEYNGKSYNANDTIAQLITDKNGQSSVEKLPIGQYELKETKSVEGYQQLKSNIPVTISAGSETSLNVVKTISNTPLGALRIEKIDSVSKESLNGASFNLITLFDTTYKEKDYSAGSVIDTLTTTDDGSITVTGLEQGKYKIDEITSPAGYVITSDESIEFEIVAGTTPEPIVIENAPLGKLIIYKTDADSKASLAGAEFNIITSSAILFDKKSFEAGAVISTVTTDDKGIATIENLPYGEYQVIETKAPTNYQLDTTPHIVTISQPTKETIAVELNITNKIKTGTFSIYKLDPNINKPIVAEFDLINMDEIFFDGQFIEKDQVVIQNFNTAENGTYTSPELPVGKYQLVEVSTADNYLVPEGKYIDIEISDTETEPLVIEVYNYPKNVVGQFKLIKSDAETKEKLAGAVFEIYDDGDNLVDTITTNDNGEAYSSEVYFGDYYVKEIKAPDGYILDDTIYNITVSENDTEIPVIMVENTSYKGQIKIIKVDSTDLSKTIENVSFDIYDENNILIERVNTDHNGEALSKLMPFGTYTIKEVSTPEGYVINTTPISIELKSESINENTIKTVIVENTPISGQITVIKVDANDNTVKLSGAEFNVIDKNNNIVQTLITDKNGEAKTDILDLGKYTIVETKAPEGYVLSTETYTVTLGTNDSTEAIVYESITIENTPQKKEVKYPKAKIELLKVDATDKSKVLNGAEFEVTAVTDISEDKLIYSAGEVVCKLITGTDGKAISPTLPIGTYTIKETKAPDGYILDTKPITISLTNNDTENIAIETITVTNTKTKTEVIRGRLQVVKKDSETLKTLKNVKFEIYAETDIIDNGIIIYKKDQLIESITTNNEGIATSSELPLGKYYVIEATELDGYVINTSKYSYQITSDNYSTIQSKTVYNVPTKVVITKEDITTAEPLSGATIEIKDSNGDVVYKDTTDKNGEIEAFYLPVGKYTFKETVAPEGYTINTSKFSFEILENGKIKGDTTITDTPTEVVITKKDLTTGAPLAGATIEIKDSNGKIVFKEISGPNGEVKVMNLPVGTYTFTEIAAPDGYTRNPESFEFEIYEDGTIRGDCTITDTPTEVVITKKDLTTGTPLAGATIEIIDSNGKTVFKEVSGPNGEVKAMKLPIGKYTFRETSAPDGYSINTETFEFEIKENGEIIGDCAITDKPTEVIITKKDLTNAEPLAGATIQIFDSNGKLAFEAVTKENGQIKAMKLNPGKYTFKEISAPDGYELNTETFTFELMPNGEVIGDCEIYDKPIPKIKTGVETSTSSRAPIIPILIGIAAISLASISIKKLFKNHK